MRHITTILLLLLCQHLFGQVKFGTYSLIDTSFYADMTISPDKKFDFYDTRGSSCFAWAHYIGKWELIKDTVIFSWQNNWTESFDSIISSTDFQNKNIQIKFLYDDGKPIANIKTSLSCLFDSNPKKYCTDIHGIVTIPQKVSTKRLCAIHDRMLSFDIDNKIVKLSSNTSLDYYAASLRNKFTIIIKKKPRSYSETITKKYLLNGNTLVDIDRKEFYNYNWGDLKFISVKYGR